MSNWTQSVDPETLLHQADSYCTNAVHYAESFEEREQRTAAIFAQVALARAVSALAAAQLKTSSS